MGFKLGGVLVALALAVGGCSASKQVAPKAGAETARAPVAKRHGPCASNQHCPVGLYCTTEDGMCHRDPSCKTKDQCAKVCYGSCIARRGFALTLQ